MQVASQLAVALALNQCRLNLRVYCPAYDLFRSDGIRDVRRQQFKLQHSSRRAVICGVAYTQTEMHVRSTQRTVTGDLHEPLPRTCSCLHEDSGSHGAGSIAGRPDVHIHQRAAVGMIGVAGLSGYESGRATSACELDAQMLLITLHKRLYVFMYACSPMSQARRASMN